MSHAPAEGSPQWWYLAEREVASADTPYDWAQENLFEPEDDLGTLRSKIRRIEALAMKWSSQVGQRPDGFDPDSPAQAVRHAALDDAFFITSNAILTVLAGYDPHEDEQPEGSVS